MTTPTPEQQLIEYRAILEHTGIAVIFTRNRRVERCNSRAEELFGWPIGTLSGQAGRVFYPNDAAYAEMGRLAGPVLAAGESYETDVEMARRDGSVFLGHVVVRAIDPSNADAGTTWIASDVTEARREAEFRRRLLREQEMIFERVHAGIMFTNRERRILRCNSRFFEIFGYTTEQLTGQSTRILGVDDASWEKLGLRGYAAATLTGSYSSEEPFRHRDGRIIWCRLSGSMLNPANLEEGFVWAFEDITQRRQNSEELRRVMLEQQRIFDRADIGIAFICDRVIQRCNRHFEEMLGFAPGTAVGRSTRSYFCSESDWREIGQEAYRSITQTGAYRGEKIFCRQDGTPIWCRFSGTLLDPENPELGFVWLHEDVSERHQTELALNEARRQQALVFDNAMIGISYQRNRVILHCNRRLEEIFGHPPGSLSGCSTRVLFASDEAWNETGRTVYQTASETSTFDGVICYARQDGSPLWAHVVGRSIEAEDKEETWIWTYEDVSARRATELALNQTMSEYAQIFDNALVGISYMHRRVILRCNRRMEEICGFAPGTLIGQNTRQFYASEEDYRDTARRVAAETLPGSGFSADLRYRRQDGQMIWVRVNGRPIRDGDQENWIWTHQDVSQQHEAEEALRRSHDELERRVIERTEALKQQLHFLSQLIEGIPGPVYYKDRDGRYLGCNQAYADYVGIAPADLNGKTVFDIAPAALAENYKTADDALFANPGAQVYESQVALASGELRDVMFHKATYAQMDGSVGGIVGVLLDITERKRMEERLLQASTVFDSTVEGVMIAALDGTILAVNPAFTQITGYAEDEAIGRNPRFLQSGRQDRRFYDAMWTTVSHEGRWSGEVWNRRKDGRIFPEWMTLSAVRDKAGAVTHYICVFSDIEALKQAESEQRIAATAFDAHQSMFITDSDGIIVRVNQAFTQDIGYSAGEIVGKTPRILRSGHHDEAFYQEMWQSIQGAGRWAGEIWDRRKDGQIFPAWLTISAVIGADGAVTHYVAHLLDITERKQAQMALEQTKREVDLVNASLEQRISAAVEELDQSHRSLMAVHQQLTQTETMASLGRMVAIIAHELNTPIGNSRLAASTLRARAGEFAGMMAKGVKRSDLDSLLDAIEKGTHLLDSGLQRAAHLISSFKQIAVDQTSSQRRVFTLDTLIDEITTTLEPSIRRAESTLSWRVESGIELDSYPGPLGHVLMNLIDNAVRHAFSGQIGGAIEVSIAVAANSPIGELELRVCDNGVGILPAHIKHIFEPFFTTQMGRGGTGLGLSIVYNIVTGVLGGRIEVHSVLGQGTCFLVHLPTVSPEATAVRP